MSLNWILGIVDNCFIVVFSGTDNKLARLSIILHLTEFYIHPNLCSLELTNVVFIDDVERLLYERLRKHRKLRTFAFCGVLPPLMIYRLILRFRLPSTPVNLSLSSIEISDKNLVLLGGTLCDNRNISIIGLHCYSNKGSGSVYSFLEALQRSGMPSFLFCPIEQFHQTVMFLVGRWLAQIRHREQSGFD